MKEDRAEPTAGFSLLEVVIATAILLTVMAAAGEFFLKSSDCLSSMVKNVYTTSRALVVLDRLEDELLTGNFASLVPPVPKATNYVEFEKIVGVSNGMPVYGNTIRIELIDAENGDSNDGIDNDGNGLVDEHAIRIWEDFPPFGPGPGPEDVASIICANATKDGLQITRQGGVLLIDLTLQEGSPGQAPATIKLQSGVKMRNDN